MVGRKADNQFLQWDGLETWLKSQETVLLCNFYICFRNLTYVLDKGLVKSSKLIVLIKEGTNLHPNLCPFFGEKQLKLSPK